MYNVLHVIGYMGSGGDTSVVLDVLDNMDKSKFHFDFVTHNGAKENCIELVRNKGSKVFVMDGDVRQLGLHRYYKEFLALLEKSETKYDAIHVHTGMQSGVALSAARKAGIPNRICHSHVTSIQRKASVIKKIVAVPIFRYLYMKNSTQKVSCSRDSGNFLYGRKADFTVVYNAVDTERYLNISPQKVYETKKSLGFGENDILIGHVARMRNMKNQRFVLSLAEKLSEQAETANIKFVLVGEDTDFEEIKRLAENMPNVTLTGRRSDIPVLMKMFDCVILPSLPGEGFPVTMLEAQAAGCRCIISENVTNEVEVGLKLVKSIPLSDTEAWLSELKSVSVSKDTGSMYAEKLMAMGFSSEQFVKNWLNLYK